jgi:hypothetical protein
LVIHGGGVTIVSPLVSFTGAGVAMKKSVHDV